MSVSIPPPPQQVANVGACGYGAGDDRPGNQRFNSAEKYIVVDHVASSVGGVG